MEYTNNVRINSETSLKSEDIFHALDSYKKNHSLVNLQKLCVEITEFLRAVYASTRSDEERNVYRAMVDKLK